MGMSFTMNEKCIECEHLKHFIDCIDRQYEINSLLKEKISNAKDLIYKAYCLLDKENHIADAVKMVDLEALR
jgi:hypothetical protein